MPVRLSGNCIDLFKSSEQPLENLKVMNLFRRMFTKDIGKK